jgi:hypothetical protein
MSREISCRRPGVGAVFGLVATLAAASCGPEPVGGRQNHEPESVSEDPWRLVNAGPTRVRPKVSYPARRAVSAPLGQARFQAPRGADSSALRQPRVPESRAMRSVTGPRRPDSVLDTAAAAGGLAPPATVNVDGASNADNQAVLGVQLNPPDANGDVGPNHYVQWVNLVFAVFDKQGQRVFGPAPGNLPWQGLGGPCETNNDGDVLILYDQLADRWVFSQFAISNDGHQCIAVSQTPDPLGPYYQYDFVVSPGGLNDYPKMGVWPDGYYATYNDFVGFGFRSAVAVAFDRQAMLQGLPAALVQFDIIDTTGAESYFAVQPSHLEGLTPPPAGTPNVFAMAFDDEVWAAGGTPDRDAYKLWSFHVDWADPSQSSFIGPVTVPTAEFNADLCGGFGACIAQPNTGQTLDALSQFTMYRASYRQFADHAALLINHTVDADGSNRAGVRWAELRNPAAAVELAQTGTFAPDDGLHRWMGSLAMDSVGNIALGYTVASGDTFPSVRYAGRLADDPAGLLTQGEVELVAGTSALASSRWGDYSSMSVDEADGCSFWYTQEYARGGDWGTRIGSFAFPNCAATELGVLRGTVTTSDGAPLAGARVGAGALSTLSNDSGEYQLRVPVGTYDVEAAGFGYIKQTEAGVTIEADAVVQIDFALQAAPITSAHGFVYDGAAAGWPLYAKLVFSATGAPPMKVFTDPETGYYQVELVAGVDYQVAVSAVVPGYLPQHRPITVGMDQVQANFALEVNTGTCEAPGYARETEELLREDFAVFPPEGWSVANATEGCDGVPDWTNMDPGGRGNLTGGTGAFAIADSDACGSGAIMDAQLLSAPLDLSGFGPDDGLLVEFRHDYFDLGSQAAVDISVGAAWESVALYTGQSDRGPKVVQIGTRAGNGNPQAQLRWRFLALGWHWWWQIDDVQISRSRCSYQGGGLLIGTVSDQNTGEPVVGAQVAVTGGAATETVTSDDDPEVEDGFYALFVPGTGAVTASKDRYGTASEWAVVQRNGVSRLDLALPAGLIEVTPAELSMRVAFADQGAAALTVQNWGNHPAGFELFAVPGGPAEPRMGPFAPTGRRTSPKRINATTAEFVRVPFVAPAVPVLAAGAVTGGFAAVPGAWGLGIDRVGGDVWVGSTAAVAGGDDRLHRYSAAGVATGETIDVAAYAAVFTADLAYNRRSRTFWHVNVGGDNCIHEVDPAARTITGARICPAWGTSQRGLAYDAVTDTFYAGSWNDGVIRQFDADGTILRSVNVGLNVSGLAYNPATQHLFVLTNSDNAGGQLDVYVVDTSSDLVVTGGFELLDQGSAVLPDFSQAALELDCEGNLLAVDQANARVVVATSGEPGPCGDALQWLTIDPASGVVAPRGSLSVNVAALAAGLVPGVRRVQLLLSTDTPYSDPGTSFTVTVAFRDVPAAHPYDRAIHELAGAGVSAGCGAGNFCPDRAISRAELAMWLLRAKLGSQHVPPPATGIPFDDVSPESFAADSIEEVAALGIMGSCGGRRFCPDAPVTNEGAALWLLRAIEGAHYVPPPGTGLFNDVPDDPLLPWIEELYRRGIGPGCGGGNYCPDAETSRGAMAELMVRGFALRSRK